MRAAVARNPRAPTGTLLNLAQDKDNVWVRAGVAANPSCPPEAYRKLMWDRQASVRNALLVNPTVPRKVVARQIFHDPTAAVHVALASRADLTPPASCRGSSATQGWTHPSSTRSLGDGSPNILRARPNWVVASTRSNVTSPLWRRGDAKAAGQKLVGTGSGWLSPGVLPSPSSRRLCY